MSKYTPTFSSQKEFDGDQVSVEFRRMKRKHMMLIASKSEINADGKSVIRGTPDELLDTMASVIKECVVSVDLLDANGTAVSIDTIIEDLYFFDLAMWMLNELMSNSRIAKNGDDEKNSVALPADQREAAASGLTAS